MDVQQDGVEQRISMRRGPTDGYNFSRKRDYRRSVWSFHRENVTSAGIQLSAANALLMPSLEGDEIDVALNAGFRLSNLHIVDSNPAIVATLKRRYPLVNTYGVDVREAIRRITKSGVKLNCLNLDFCGQFSTSYAMELAEVVLRGLYDGRKVFFKGGFNYEFNTGATGCFSERTSITVTMLRGRESNASTAHLVSIKASDSYLVDVQQEVLEQLHHASSCPPKVKTNGDKYVRRCIQILSQLSERDRQRVMGVMQVLGLTNISADYRFRPAVLLQRAESYPSSNGQTMLWVACELERFETCFSRHQHANEKRAEMGYAPVPFKHF
jgi:hypothetical protein